MKVVHVVRQYLPSVGGMEEVVRNLARQQLAEGRYQPRVVTLDRVFREPRHTLPHSEVMDGVPVQRLAWRGSERYPLCPQVLGTLHGADLVHVHGIDFFFDWLALTRPWHGKPLIASTHGGFFHTPYAQRLKQLFFRTVTRCSALAYRRIIATSENDGSIFSQVVGPTRLRVIENGVDVHKFADAGARSLQPTLIYFGRWSVNKGLLELLDLLAALRRLQPGTPWRLIIAGREYDLDCHGLTLEASERGVLEALELVPGPSDNDLRVLLGRASYFACLSHHEGFGIAPIEAMSAGLTPVLSAIAPFAQLVAATGVGLVLARTDAVAQALQLAQLHDALGQGGADGMAVSRAAAQRAAAGYAWGGVAARYTAQYDQVLGAR